MSIFDNKIAYVPKFKLQLTIHPGCMLDGESWTPARELPMPYEDLQIIVSYDDLVLAQQNLNVDSIVITENLLDSPSEHQLKIKLTGKADKHTRTVEGQVATAMIYVEVQIEELPLNLALNEQQIYQTDSGELLHWAEFMGINGTQTISVSTPIYPWLFKYEKEILSEFRRKG